MTLREFIADRLNSYLIDRGYNRDEISAVLSAKPKYLYEIPERIQAIREFMKMPEAGDLIKTAKRVRKIIDKHDKH